MKIAFDENGSPVCPLVHNLQEWSVDGNTVWYRPYPCEAELSLIVSLRITPGQADPIVRRSEFTNQNALTSGWKFECANGHVLAVSCEEEEAEDFTWLAEQMVAEPRREIDD